MTGAVREKAAKAKKATWRYVLKRLKEKSTWVGIVTVIAVVASWFGADLTAQQKAEIITVGLGIVGILNIFLHEKTSEVKDDAN